MWNVEDKHAHVRVNADGGVTPVDTKRSEAQERMWDARRRAAQEAGMNVKENL